MQIESLNKNNLCIKLREDLRDKISKLVISIKYLERLLELELYQYINLHFSHNIRIISFFNVS